jgi:hypothetical protein
MRVLNPGDSTRILLHGTDQYGNSISAGDVNATWTSSTASVATVAADGTVLAVASGRSTVTGQVGSSTVRVHVTVNWALQEETSISGYVGSIHGEGGRLLAAGWSTDSARTLPRVWRLEGSTWLQESPPSEVSEGSIRVLPGGDAWLGGRLAAGNYEVFHAPAPQSWTSVSLPYEPTDRLLLASVGSTVFSLGMSGYPITRPVVHRRGSGEWIEYPFSLPLADSAMQMLGITALSVTEVYVVGLVQRSYANGGGRAFIGRWDGTQWADLAIPSAIDVERMSVVSKVEASSSDQSVYAVLLTGSPPYRYHLLKVSGSEVVEVPNPLTSAGMEIRALAVGPNGSVHIGGDKRVFWQDGADWSEHAFADGWTMAGDIHVDESGTIWVPAHRHDEVNTEFTVLKIVTR